MSEGLLIALAIIGALLIFFKFGSVFNYLCMCYSMWKIAKRTGEGQVDRILLFVPYINYIKMANMVNKQQEKVVWLEPLITISVILSALFTLNILKFYTLGWVVSIILSFFKMYLVSKWSFTIGGRVNLIALLLAFFGYDGYAMLWVTKDMN